MDTPPHAPELELADLPPYDDEQHNDDAHLGPYPLALVAIQAALTAFQYEEHQLLDDPRSERCLQDLDDALGAFMAYNFPPAPLDPNPVEHQAHFTPQIQVAVLPGSPGPWDHPVPVNAGPDFEAEDAEHAAPAQFVPAPLSDASSDAASHADSANDGASVSENGDLMDEEQSSGGPPSPAGSIRSEQSGAMAAEAATASSTGMAREGASNTASSGMMAAPFTLTGVPPPAPGTGSQFGYLVTTSQAAGPSYNLSGPVMPKTRAGIEALAYISEHCEIPDDERDMESALIHVVQLISKKDKRQDEDHLQVADSPAEVIQVDIGGQARLALKTPPASVTGHSQNSKNARGRSLDMKGVRGIFHSLRQGLRINSS
ncbi:hypothetical protein PENSPDRAFT_732947 [Peniophora sp. CONT]|nr:hypothetical protein PENSPDRAFT_732947 [Peniophora sp. CONT]